MKKIILSAIATLSIAATMMVSAHAQTIPTIIVDERELVFEDQQPVIVEETGRTLIPLRFVLETSGASVNWDGENRTVFVSASDNRNKVLLTIGSNEMKMYYYPSVMEVVEETKILDQAPIIMNDRTMIPVRAVQEAIGSKVDWDEENNIINITSRAYTRYLKYVGVEGTTIEYPLSGGDTPFERTEPKEADHPYDRAVDLLKASISSETTKAEVGETVEIFLNLDNVDKLGIEDAILSNFSFALKYDKEKLLFKGYELLRDGKTIYPVMDAVNPDLGGDSVKVVTIATLGNNNEPPVTDGVIAKAKFEVLSKDTTEVSLSSRTHAGIGKDLLLSFKTGEKMVKLGEANEVYIDTTPIKINE